MRHLFFIIALLFSVNSFAQEDAKMLKATEAAEKFVKSYIDKPLFSKYIQTRSTESKTISGGYKIAFEVKPEEIYNQRVSFIVVTDDRFNVVFPDWDIVESAKRKFMLAVASLTETADSKRMLSPEDVSDFVKAEYPQKKWGKPRLSRDRMPPFTFYWEMMEYNCNPCDVAEVKLDQKVILNKKATPVSPIR